MLRIAEHWYASDRGRQRQGNEDNFFVAAPLFVVADGMGGAQAGEVASEVAVDAFNDLGSVDESPERALVEVIKEANHRIYEISQSERAHAGMGTTVTALYINAEDAFVAHVGDSRAYVLRDGQLERLTTDHSLVGELVARGKLTEREAEAHPQRSVITRALGPEPTVAVDVQKHPAQAGDIYLLCSDGLTSMVPEDRLQAVLAESRSLAQMGERLISAANEAGGRDNITVILVRVADADDVPDEDESAEDLTTPPIPVTRTQAQKGETHTAKRNRFRRKPREAEAQLTPRRYRRRRSKKRLFFGLLTTFIVLALVGMGGWIATRAVYFLGTDSTQQTVAVFRGVPFELPGGIKLYERFVPSGVTLEQIPARRRTMLVNHQLRSRRDAESLLRALQRGEIEG